VKIIDLLNKLQDKIKHYPITMNHIELASGKKTKSGKFKNGWIKVYLPEELMSAEGHCTDILKKFYMVLSVVPYEEVDKIIPKESGVEG